MAPLRVTQTLALARQQLCAAPPPGAANAAAATTRLKARPRPRTPIAQATTTRAYHVQKDDSHRTRPTLAHTSVIVTPRCRRQPISLLSALPHLAPSSGGNGGGASPPPREIRARRTLRYTPTEVYALIADVDSYASFLPYCQASRVTAWAALPASASAGPEGGATQQRWPRRADLTVGWGPFTESYTSRLFCVPGEVVEAVSGVAGPTIPRETLARLGLLEEISDAYADAASSSSSSSSMEGGIFKSLVTRWTVRPTPARRASGGGGSEVAGDWTDVMLSVQFQFANPALGLLVEHLAEEKADEMIQAFEQRARKLYG